MPRFIGGTGGEAERLGGLRVAVLGVGAVGRNVALHLARLMPAALTLADTKHYKAESLLTQPIDPDDVGRPKASSTAELCARISPSTRVEAFDGGLEEIDMSVFADVDCAFLATDNLVAEQAAGTRATALQIPLIQASVHGASLTAQVRVFGNRGGDGPCPLCAFGHSEWADMHREIRFSCDPDDPEGAAEVGGRETRSVSALCSTAADLAVMQMMRLTLGLGAPVTDTLLEYNAYRCRSVLSPLARNPDCPAEHRGWARAEAPRPLRDCTLAELAIKAGVSGACIEQAAFVVNGRRFYEVAACAEGHIQRFGRFVAHPAARARVAAPAGGPRGLGRSTPTDRHPGPPSVRPSRIRSRRSRTNPSGGSSSATPRRPRCSATPKPPLSEVLR